MEHRVTEIVSLNEALWSIDFTDLSVEALERRFELAVALPVAEPCGIVCESVCSPICSTVCGTFCSPIAKEIE